MRPLFLAICLALVLAATARADFTHAPSSPVNVGGQPFAVATADFNADGRMDVAVANEGDDSVAVLLRQANGTYAHEAGSPFAAGDGPISVAVGDLDDDGRRDLALANFAGDTITILLRQPGGGFAPGMGSPIAVGSQPTSVAVADFDLDGRDDLAVSEQNPGTVTVLLQGATGFDVEGAPIAVGTLPHEVIAVQLDSNFGPDLAVTSQRDDTVTILLRRAVSGFDPGPGSPITVGTNPLGLATGDFDGDDDADLAVANWASDSVTVLEHTALNTFLPNTLQTGDQPYGVAVADFNQDGLNDIAVSHEAGANVGIFLRQGAGFAPASYSPIGGFNNPLRLAAARLDADNRVDLVVPDRGTGLVSLLRNARGTRITSGPDGPTNDNTPTFEFDSDEANATFECALDGGTFAACDTPHTTPQLDDGPHEFAVRAIGDPTPATRAFVVDTVAPETTITSGPAGIVNAAPAYGFTANEPASFECRVTAAFAGCGSPFTAAVPGPGAYEFAVRAIDLAGNVDPTPATRAFQLVPAGEPPRNVIPPKVIATSISRVYRCDRGAWQDADSFTFQWYRVYSLGKPSLVGTQENYFVPSAYVGYTFFCRVTAKNEFGSTTASSPWAVLTAEQYISPFIHGAAYNNFRVRGIDVFQVVQPHSGATMFGFPSGAFGSLGGGGTPTNYRPDGSLAGPAQRATYQGVPVDADKPVTAVVYVNMTGAAASAAGVPLDVTLRFFRDGAPVGSVTQQMHNPPRSASPVVTLAERDSVAAGGIAFPIPLWVLNGSEFSLQADVSFPMSELLKNRRECDDLGCETDNRFRLDGVPVARMPALTVLGVEMYNGQTAQKGGLFDGSVDKDGKPIRATADRVMAKARQVWPGGESLLIPTVARLDVGNEENYLVDDDECDDVDAKDDRSCRQYYLTHRLLNWRTDDPVAKGFGPYQASLGFFDYPGEAGWAATGCCGTLASFNPKAGGSPVFFADAGRLGRPLTAAAHEWGHVLSAPHAERGPACGGDTPPQVGEDWGPDNAGRLQGVKYDWVQPGIRPDPAADTAANMLFDLMSYCTNGNDAVAWVSARNWNRAFTVMQDFGQKMNAKAARVLLQAGGQQGFAVGVFGGGAAKVTRFVPPDGADQIPSSVVGSRIRLRALDAAGAVIGESGASVAGTGETGDGGAFVAPVPAAARTIDVVLDGAVVSRFTRSAAAPRVKLERVRLGRDVTVRWTASDPDGGALTAAVDYSPDGGRTWRTVLEGPDRGSAKLAGTLLAGSPRGRIRVTVSDGFQEASAVSRPLRIAGAPAQIEIVSAEPVGAGERMTLAGRAIDDRQRPLRRMTWFAGKRRLGTGERITVRLAAGRVTLRLVAGGGEARKTVRIARAPLRLLDADVPQRVKRGEQRLAVRLTVSAAATLRAGGRSYRLRAGANRVTLRLPRRPATGLVKLPLRIGAISTEVTIYRG